MDLLELLPAEHVVVPLSARDVHEGILQLARRLDRTGVVEDFEAVERRVRDQPVADLVAVTPDVVLPHYRSEGVARLGLALGISPEPIPGDGGRAFRVIALIVAPPETAALYLQTHSTLARLFRQTEVVEAMARAPAAEAVLALPVLEGLRIQHSLVVRDVMTHRIQSVPPDYTVRRTLDIMLRRKLSAVPVVGEKGEVLGMVTDSDIMRALLPSIPRGGDEEPGEAVPEQRPVREIMTRSVLCVSEDLGVGEAAGMMINKDVEQLPVVNAGSIAGMVYRGDIIRKLFGRA